jgi:hypothetical protein
MWAFSTSQVTVYSIQPERGFEQGRSDAGSILRGLSVAGRWSIYPQSVQALHQTCLSHLLRRCRELISVAGRKEAQLLCTAKNILQQSLQLRDRHAQGQISKHGVAVTRGRLESRLDRLVRRAVDE